MKRRTALVSSAVVSIGVLGGAVAAAALSGAGVLGFGGVSGTREHTGVESAPTGPPTAVSDPVSDSGVRVRVIEDRVVVMSPAATGSDDIVRSAVDAALRARSGMRAMTNDGDDVGLSTVPPVVNPPGASVHDDDHDEYDDDDEYVDEHEHEHDHEHEYEDDEYEHE